MSTNRAFPCTFLRYSTEGGAWLENNKLCLFEVSQNGGVSVRENESGSLIGDFPKASIRNVESMNSVVARIYTSAGVRIGVKFNEPSHLIQVFKLLKDNDILVSDVNGNNSSSANAHVMPDLGDPIVQEFVLQLLFREDFSAFCEDLNELFEGFADEMM